MITASHDARSLALGPSPRKGPIIITGGEGFVGRWLIRALRELAPEIEVLAADRSGRANLQLDVTDATAVAELIRILQPQTVVHLAALSFVPEAEKNPYVAYEVNLFGSMNVATAVLRHAPQCRVIFVSSSEVYGRSFRDHPLDETAALSPTNIYASTKAAADLLMGQYACRGLDVVRFRPFNHIGPGQSDRFVIPSFVRQIVAAERGEQPPVIRVGNIDSIRDFLDVRDVARGYALAVVQPAPLPVGCILNLASGNPRRIGEILDQLVAQAAIPLEIHIDPVLLRPTDLPTSIGDARRACALLGWVPQLSLDQTLSDMLATARSSFGEHWMATTVANT